MPVALIMSVLLDLVELHGIERSGQEMARPVKPAPVLDCAEVAPSWEEAERWDGLS